LQRKAANRSQHANYRTELLLFLDTLVASLSLLALAIPIGDWH
jgi:hypothetical protein